LVAAAQSAHRVGLYATAWQLPTALYGFFDLRKYWSEWIDSHRLALDAARRLSDRDAEGRILCNLGNAYRPLYRLDEAVDCYREALAIFREIGWRQGEAKVLGNLGTMYDDHGAFDEAVAHQLAALAIFEDLGDDYGAALTLTNLGASYAELNQTDEALSVHEAALARFVRLKDIEGQGRPWATRARCSPVPGHTRTPSPRWGRPSRCYARPATGSTRPTP
jgi:tetratricopeptide (TPR) repeat protein